MQNRQTDNRLIFQSFGKGWDEATICFPTEKDKNSFERTLESNTQKDQWKGFVAGSISAAIVSFCLYYYDCLYLHENPTNEQSSVRKSVLENLEEANDK